MAAYKQFDVLLVNAIFDGMNLVAKEAPLVNERDGVVVLSENTGAHAELGEWALSVNPFDVEGQAEAIATALSMEAGRAARATRGDSRARARARPRTAGPTRCSRPSTAWWRALAVRIETGMSELSHVSEAGDVRMVDVGGKPLSRRRAIARATVRMAPETARRLRELPKGDALTTAQVAGIMAAKRTSELIPLCHPLPLSLVEVVARGGRAAVSTSPASPRRRRRPASRWKR